MQITSKETTPNQFVYRDALNTCLDQLNLGFYFHFLIYFSGFLITGHPTDAMLLWLGSYLSVYLSACLSVCLVVGFRPWPSRPIRTLFFKKTNHFAMTTLNIRSDPMATWECAKQVQASPHSCLLLTFICL